MHPVRHVALPAFGMLFLAAAAATIAQPPKSEQGAGQESIVDAAARRKAAVGVKGDEAGVRAAIAAYTAAFNKGDAAALAEMWSPDGVYTTGDGGTFQGRPAIARALAEGLKEAKGETLDVGNPSVRFLTPDVAAEEGVARTLRNGVVIEEMKYLALYVHRDGKWLLDSVRETAIVAAPSNADKLAALEWLVGEWVSDGPEGGEVAVRVDWAKNRSFLRASFRVSVGGKVEQEATQVIGWDPARGTIRAWVFDSDSGFGESTWSIKDNRFTIVASATLPDGRTAQATHLLTKVGPDAYTWKSIGRKVGDDFLPNVAETKFVRKPAAKEGAAK